MPHSDNRVSITFEQKLRTVARLLTSLKYVITDDPSRMVDSAVLVPRLFMTRDFAVAIR